MTKILFLVLMLVFNQEIRSVLTRKPNKKSESILVKNVQESQETRRKVIKQLVKHSTKDRTVLLPGYELVTRKIIMDIKQFKNYGDVSTFTFIIKEDVIRARFTFQCEYIQMNVIGHCEPQNVVINMKRASFPAVNPDNYEFPEHFISSDRREKIHTLEIVSNGGVTNYFINNPKPGSWYALVYIKWQDPKKESVKQQGLGADCLTFLYSDLQVRQEQNIELIDCYTNLEVDYADLPYISKCLTSGSIEPINLSINIKNTAPKSDLILFRVQALTFPSEKEYLAACAFDPKLNTTQAIMFSPYPNVLHYIHLEHRIYGSPNYINCELYKFRADLAEQNVSHSVLDFTRHDEGQFSTFEYGTHVSNILDASNVINLKHNEIKSVRFQVNQVEDIGGNLLIKASFYRSLEYYLGNFMWAKEFRRKQLFKTVICVDVGYASIPLKTGHCKFNNNVRKALFVLNSTDTESVFETSIIPYPDSGSWFLTMRLFLINSDQLLRMPNNVTKSYTDIDEEIEKVKTKREDSSGKDKNEIEDNRATVILSVSSMVCIKEECSEHGDCKMQNMDLAISFCSCHKGYGAWDCSDASRMESKWLLLMAVLLLTLSNFFFLITIYVAIIRIYYTEAVMYFFTMVFSTFYHACDAPQLVAFCLYESLELLSFSDFFCGILCFWVTLLAVSLIREKLRTLLQLIGAVLIAILTYWDRHSLVTFAVPVLIGSGIVALSWFWDHSSLHIWRYPKNYYVIYLPVGLILASIGLICFAFLQTEENYKIVHSFWHGVVALSVAFMLPDSRREGNRNPFLPKPNFFRLPLLRIFSKSRSVPNHRLETSRTYP